MEELGSGSPSVADAPAFLAMVPLPGPHSRAMDYALSPGSLDPVISALDLVLGDRDEERQQGTAPVYCLDYSELHYLWSSSASSGGRRSSIDSSSMLINTVIQEGKLRLYLPPGTVCEIVYQLSKILGQPSEVIERLTAALSDPTKGMREPPDFAAIRAMLPSSLQLAHSLQSRKRRDGGLDALLRIVESGAIQLLHEKYTPLEQGSIIWDNASFQSAIKAVDRPDLLSRLWDALNLAMCASINRSKIGDRVYLISRGWIMKKAAAQLPGGRGKVFRTAEYLRLCSAIKADTSSALGLLELGDLVGKLRQVRRTLQFVQDAEVTQAKTGKPDRDHQALSDELAERIRDFGARYESYSRALFMTWESYRLNEREEKLPLDDFRIVQSPRKADWKTALRLAEFLKAGAFIESVTGGQATIVKQLITRESETRLRPNGKRVTHAVFLLTESRQPVLWVDRNESNSSYWWNGLLDIHSFLDQYERFCFAAADLESRVQVTRIDRLLDWSFTLIGRASDGHERVRRGVDGAGLVDEHYREDDFRLDRSLGIELREHIVGAAQAAEAIRCYTPYGDLWMNFEHGVQGALRTGIVSHLPIDYFVALSCAATSPMKVPIDTLWKVLTKTTLPKE